MNKRAPVLIALLGLWITTSSFGQVIFSAGFETTDLPSYVAGQQVHHAGGPPYRWNWSGSDIGVISSDPDAVYAGDQGMAALRSTGNGSQYWWTRGTNAFDRQESGVVEFEFAVKASGWANTPNSLMEVWVQGADVTAGDSAANKTNRSAWLVLTGNGVLQAYTNNSVALTVASGILATNWNRIRVALDLDQETFTVFLNDIPVASDFTFYGSGPEANAISSLQFKEYNNGQSSGGVYLDSLSLASIPPVEPPPPSLFFAGFEPTDTPAYGAGQQLHVAGGPPYRWNWSGSDIGVISSDPTSAYEGSQGLAALRSTFNGSQYWWTRGTNAFARQENGVVEISYAVKASGWSATDSSLLEVWAQGADVTAGDSAANKTNRSAWLVLTGSGVLQAYTNNSMALTVATGVLATNWNRIRLALDLDQRTFNVFLNEQHVATNFTFYGSGTQVGGISSLQFKEYNAGQTTGGVYLDHVRITQPAAGPLDVVVTQFTALPGQGVAATFIGEINISYTLQYTTNLTAVPPAWRLAEGVSASKTGDGSEITLEDTASGDPFRAYRIVTP